MRPPGFEPGLLPPEDRMLPNYTTASMRKQGFEPRNSLRDKPLKLAPLTTWLPLHKNIEIEYLLNYLFHFNLSSKPPKNS